MNENFNRQFVMIQFAWIKNSKYLQFAKSLKNAIWLYLAEKIYRGKHQDNRGLFDYYWKRRKLTCFATQGEIAEALGVKRGAVNTHIRGMKEMEVLESEPGEGRGDVYILGEWIDVSKNQDKSKRHEFFYLDRAFGENETPPPAEETDDSSTGDSDSQPSEGEDDSPLDSSDDTPKSDNKQEECGCFCITPRKGALRNELKIS